MKQLTAQEIFDNAIACLYLEIDKSIVDDIKAKWEAVKKEYAGQSSSIGWSDADMLEAFSEGHERFTDCGEFELEEKAERWLNKKIAAERQEKRGQN